MPSPSAVIRSFIQRAIPSLMGDNPNLDTAVRLAPYGEIYNQPLVRKVHNLVDEGSYFVANNNQTGIASPAQAAFSATAPMLIVTNNYPSNSNLRVYLDYLALVTTAAGSWASAGVNEQLVLVVDSANRYSSGGTTLTPNNPNPGAVTQTAPKVGVYFGAPTATAVGSSAATISGLRILRPAASATVPDVVGELKVLNFGGVEAMLNGAITVGSANMISHPMPPVVLPPGASALLYLILNGTTPGAASFAPELGLFVR
jgi:hypothetical protein